MLWFSAVHLVQSTSSPSTTSGALRIGGCGDTFGGKNTFSCFPFLETRRFLHPRLWRQAAASMTAARLRAEETSRSWSEWLWKCNFRSTVDRWHTPAEIARECQI